jgi:hypothetical protein
MRCRQRIPDRKFLTSAYKANHTHGCLSASAKGWAVVVNAVPQVSSFGREPRSYPIAALDTPQRPSEARRTPAVCAIVYETKRYDYIYDVLTGNYSIIILHASARIQS